MYILTYHFLKSSYNLNFFSKRKSGSIFIDLFFEGGRSCQQKNV